MSGTIFATPEWVIYKATVNRLDNSGGGITNAKAVLLVLSLVLVAAVGLALAQSGKEAEGQAAEPDAEFPPDTFGVMPAVDRCRQLAKTDPLFALTLDGSVIAVAMQGCPSGAVDCGPFCCPAGTAYCCQVGGRQGCCEPGKPYACVPQQGPPWCAATSEESVRCDGFFGQCWRP